MPRCSSSSASARSPGDGADYAAETVRRAVGAGSPSARRHGKGRDRAVGVRRRSRLRAAAEGALLGAYAFDRYRFASRDGAQAAGRRRHPRGRPRPAPPPRRSLQRAEAVAAGVDASPRPGQRPALRPLPGRASPRCAVEAAAAAGVTVTVLDEKALRKGGYGGIIGVGQGSCHPPRLVRRAYTHPKATRTVALVGKGITFDSGGISIKPAAAMEWMKSDMGGAAAVLADRHRRRPARASPST